MPFFNRQHGVLNKKTLISETQPGEWSEMFRFMFVWAGALPSRAAHDEGREEGEGAAGDVLDGGARHRRPGLQRKDHGAGPLHAAHQVGLSPRRLLMIR